MIALSRAPAYPGNPLVLRGGSGARPRDVNRELRSRPQAQLGEGGGKMGLHRLRADAERGGDLSVVTAREDVQRNLPLPPRQGRQVARKWWGMRHRFGKFADGVCSCCACGSAHRQLPWEAGVWRRKVGAVCGDDSPVLRSRVSGKPLALGALRDQAPNTNATERWARSRDCALRVDLIIYRLMCASTVKTPLTVSAYPNCRL